MPFSSLLRRGDWRVSSVAAENEGDMFTMRFLIRSAEASDLPHLFRLAGQAPLLNLPPDKAVIGRKIEMSLRSFAAHSPPMGAEYVFVLEDLLSHQVIGTSLIIAHYASEECPHFYLDILPQTGAEGRASHGLRGECLKLRSDTGGISAVGGLVLDVNHRGQKLGRGISLIRFVYMCMFPERFERTILSELMGPMTLGNVNPFWDALGRRFTGLSYEQAFQMATQKRKDFLGGFPDEDISLNWLDPEIHPCRERVVPGSGQAEQHLLESVGFHYLDRVDPLDGGIMYGALLSEISIVREGIFCKATPTEPDACPYSALMGVVRDGRFRGGEFPVKVSSHTASLPGDVLSALCLTNGDKVCVAPSTSTKVRGCDSSDLTFRQCAPGFQR
jgi:arginine N-succinyltransferase